MTRISSASAKADPRRLHRSVGLGILLAALSWCLFRGQDVNWDLQNYHEYDPFALLHGRGTRDIAPAGPQSFLNPLPYLPAYWLHHLLPPLAAGLLITAAQAVGLVLVWRIAWTCCPRPVPALAATAAAITGPVVLIELGTSLSDLLLAVPPLASILLVLREPGRAPGSLSAGILTGVAIGLKPTGLFLLPALVALAALRRKTVGGAVGSAALVVTGGFAGAMLSDGAWAVFLWRSYASPVFPFVNTLFRSHSAARVDFGDPRFHFTGWRHALAIPFALAWGSAATGELPIRDARLALAAGLAAIRLLGLPLRRRHGSPDRLDGLCAYLLLGIAGWLLLCPIERYAAILEMLSGLLAVLLATRLARGLARAPARAATTLAVTLLLVATTRTADFFHRPWSPPYRPHVPAGVPAGATYGLLSQPLAYWVATSPYPAHAFGLMSTMLENGGVLQRRLDRILHSNADRLWLLNLDEPVDYRIRAEMGIHGIVLAPPCLRAPSMIWIDTVFCRGAVAGPRTQAVSDLGTGQQVSFSSTGYGLIYELGGFEPTGADGSWAFGPIALLGIHLDARARSGGAVLSLRMAGLGGVPVHVVTITGNGIQSQSVALAPPSYAATPWLCIAPQKAGDPRQAGDGVVLIRFDTPETRSLAEFGVSPETRPLAFRLYDMSLRPVRPGECPPAARSLAR